MSSHARLSPSAAHRWINCPGSVREEAKYPEEESGKCAIDGTHSHTLLEHCLKSGIWNAHEVNGQTLKDDDGEFVVEEDRSTRVNVAISYVRDIVKAHPDCKVTPEEEVDPAHLTGRSDMNGTADIQIAYNNILEIVDYKDGMKDVSVIDNPQLEIYGLAVLAKYGLPVNGNYPVFLVKLTIIQPKLALKGLPVISSVVYSVQELLAKIGKYAIAAKATDDPNAPLKAGDHCGWCRHKGACTEANNTSMAAIGFTSVESNMPEILANTEVNTLSNDRIIKILEAEKLIVGHIEAVKAEAYRRMSNGIAVPGAKLVNGRSSQEWNLPDDQIAERLGKMGVPKDDRYVIKVISPAQVKKLKWEKKGETVTLSERQIKTLETEYINNKSGNLIVALESDSRPAVNIDASTLFQPVEQPKRENTLPDWLLPKP